MKPLKFTGAGGQGKGPAHMLQMFFFLFLGSIRPSWRTLWRSWLRICATRRKVAGSIPDDVIGIFH